MTQSAGASRWEDTGDGVTTAFGFDNRIFAATDLEVYLDGVLQESGYTVTGTAHPGGGYSSGNVTFSVAPASAVSVVIVRNVPHTQTAALPGGGPFPSARTEAMGDRAAVGRQQLAALLARCVRLLDSDVSGLTPTLPVTAPAAGQLLGADGAGTGLAWYTPADVDLAAVSAFIATLLDDADAAAALTTLGVTAFAQTLLAGTTPAGALATLMPKGSDVAAATTIVIPTDGAYFDVTGATTIAGMTVAAGRLFMLQFDGAPQLTDGASQDLGGNNIAAAAGDRALFYAHTANTPQLVAWFTEGSSPKAPGQAEAEAGTATIPRPWTAQRVSQAIAALSAGGVGEVLATSTPSGVSSVTVNGVTADHDYIDLVIIGWQPATDDKELRITTTVGASEQTGSEYAYAALNQSYAATAGGWPSATQNSASATYWAMTERGVGNATGERCDVFIRVFKPANTASPKSAYGFGYFNDSGGSKIGLHWFGEFLTAADAIDGFILRAESGGDFSADLVALVGYPLT